MRPPTYKQQSGLVRESHFTKQNQVRRLANCELQMKCTGNSLFPRVGRDNSLIGEIDLSS